LIGGEHRGGADFGAYFYTGYVIEHGHLNPNVHWYHEFPITWTFFTEIFDICGITDARLFNRIVPFMWQFIYLPVVYVFLRNTIGEEKRNYCWAGLWLFYLAEWLGFSGMAPQMLGWFFFLVTLALFGMTLLGQQTIRLPARRLSSILVFAGVTLSHWLSSVFTLVAVAMLFLRKKIDLTSVLLLTIFIGAWTIYGATQFFEANTPRFISYALRLDMVWESSLLARVVSTNPAHDFLDKVRVWYTAAFLIIGFLGLILGFKSKRNRDTHLTILAVSVGIIIASSILAFSYGTEIIDKTYLFGIPLIAYFGTKLLNHRATAVLLCILLVIAPPIYIGCHYCNQFTDRASPANLEGLYFFNEHAEAEGTLTGNYLSWGTPRISHEEPYLPVVFPLGYAFLEHPEKYQGTLYEQLYFEDDKLSCSDEVEITYPHYIAVSQRDKGIYYWNWNRLGFINQLEGSLDNAKNCNLIYTNPDMKLYIVEGVK